MEIQELQRRVQAVEEAASRSSERQLAVELDRLAEHLIGETAPELQQYKHRIQVLVTRVAPHRQHIAIYVETYCRVR